MSDTQREGGRLAGRQLDDRQTDRQVSTHSLSYVNTMLISIRGDPLSFCLAGGRDAQGRGSAPDVIKVPGVHVGPSDIPALLRTGRE